MSVGQLYSHTDTDMGIAYPMLAWAMMMLVTLLPVTV